LLSAGLLLCGLSAPALADEQGAFTGRVGGAVGALAGTLRGATIVDQVTGDYPPPYSAARPYAYHRYHHYPYSRYRHYAASPYHRHSGVEPYSYYYPEK
jgi:hypothetical protein